LSQFINFDLKLALHEVYIFSLNCSGYNLTVLKVR